MNASEIIFSAVIVSAVIATFFFCIVFACVSWHNHEIDEVIRDYERESLL